MEGPEPASQIEEWTSGRGAYEAYLRERDLVYAAARAFCLRWEDSGPPELSATADAPFDQLRVAVGNCHEAAANWQTTENFQQQE